MITDQDIVGFHHWPNAPYCVDFLAAAHRHIFRIRAGWAVEHNDRALEIFMYEKKVKDFIEQFYPKHRYEVDGVCFAGESCESIASTILSSFIDQGMKWCEVLEDGRGGSRAEA